MAAMGRIPEDYRRVIVWYQYDQHAFEEIGRRWTGLPRRHGSSGLVRCASP